MGSVVGISLGFLRSCLFGGLSSPSRWNFYGPALQAQRAISIFVFNDGFIWSYRPWYEASGLQRYGGIRNYMAPYLFLWLRNFVFALPA